MQIAKKLHGTPNDAANARNTADGSGENANK